MYYLFTDGGSRGNPGNSAAAAFLFDKEMNLVGFDAKFLKLGTNNNAEYQALVMGLKMAIKQDIKELTCKLDSELAVKQITGIYKVKDENIMSLYKSIQEASKKFDKIDFIHVPRAENKHADKLVNIILDAIENK